MAKRKARVPSRYNTSMMMYDPKKTGFLTRMKTSIREYSAINPTQLKMSERSLCEYVALMYDPNSPFWVEEKDYHRRKYEVAIAAGFQVDDEGHFDEHVEKMLLGGIRAVNNMIIGFISLFALPEYFQLVAYSALQSMETRKILKGDSNQYTVKTLEVVGEKIKGLQKKLLNLGDRDESTGLRQALYAKLNEEQVKLRLRPEEIVQKLKEQGKLDDTWSPYEEDMTIKVDEAFKFIGDVEEGKDEA